MFVRKSYQPVGLPSVQVCLLLIAARIPRGINYSSGVNAWRLQPLRCCCFFPWGFGCLPDSCFFKIATRKRCFSSVATNMLEPAVVMLLVVPPHPQSGPLIRQLFREREPPLPPGVPSLPRGKVSLWKRRGFYRSRRNEADQSQEFQRSRGLRETAADVFPHILATIHLKKRCAGAGGILFCFIFFSH